ncbi:uncharacterized protein YjbI with pentapeptide repeats [Actinokineospora baliensis]|uniref:hypothetical protein n=1 Tax=Actinokineospora baliensis TaxID=547056 RepID=UPI001956C18D|nr:hypothetical protein [Actinokineospora baliensis]MBM7773972.1 uncharacterized protein YjbI with pentapeptide repeats [Actinokineospora baliensis]
MGLDLDYFTVVAGRFERCDFEGVKIKDACFGEGVEVSEYVDCSFDGARIGAISPGLARFERCTFRNTRLVKWLCKSVEFVDCVFSGRITETNFTGTVPPMLAQLAGRTANRFERNDFSDAVLAGVSFRRGIDLLDQRLPTSDVLFIENGDVVIPKMLDRATAWPESRARSKVVAALEVQSDELANGQRHVLFTAATWEGKAYAGLDVYDKLVELASLASR